MRPAAALVYSLIAWLAGWPAALVLAGYLVLPSAALVMLRATRPRGLPRPGVLEVLPKRRRTERWTRRRRTLR